MPYVFAAEAFVFILTTLAFIVAVIARFRWRWLRLVCWLLLANFGAGAWLSFPQGRSLEELDATYPTVMALGSAALGGLTLGVTLLPLIGLWRRRENKVPIACSWRLLPIAGLAVCFLIVFTLTTFVRDIYVRDEIARARLVNRIRVAVLSPPTIAVEDDAAPLYFQIYDQLIATERSFVQSAGDEVPSGEAALPAWLKEVAEPSFDIHGSEVLSFCERHRSEARSVLAASKLPTATLREPGSRFFGETSRDRIDAIVALYRLVALEARQRAHEGDMRGCWECLSCLSRMQRHACAMRDGLWVGIARFLDARRAALTEAILAQPDLECGNFPFPLVVDTYVCRPAIMEAAQLDAAEVLELSCANDLCELDRDKRLHDANAQNALRAAGPVRTLYALYSRVFELDDGLRTYPSALAFCEDLGDPNNAVSQEDMERLNNLSDLPPSKLVSLAFMSACASYTPSIDADARRRVADLAIAIAGFRSKNGRYPRDYDDLTPDFLSKIPLDPWDGKPLRFCALDGGMLIYSVGRNQLDEQGYGDLTDPASPDITFRLGGVVRKPPGSGGATRSSN